MCEPTAIASAGMGIVSAVGQQAGAEQATSAANRAKLKNHERNNTDYLTWTTLNNAKWKNDVQLQDIQQDQFYLAMIDQWTETDRQLDKIFAQGSYKMEAAIRKMYENDYAGTQTGNTAARLAAKSVKEMGYEKSKTLHEMMFEQESSWMDKDRYHSEVEAKRAEAYDKIRFSPIHGHAPPPPEMEAAPSRAGMFMNIAGSVFTGFADAGTFSAPKSTIAAPKVPAGGYTAPSMGYGAGSYSPQVTFGSMYG